MGTQWNFTGMGQVLGLNYSSLVSVFDIFCVSQKIRPKTFNKIRFMEKKAISLIRARNKNGSTASD